MTTLGCIYHWYTSAMFVVPVLGVGGWSWWSSRKAARAPKPPRGESPRSA
jgi:hypothetical protein